MAVVETQHGKVEGEQREGDGLFVFRGIAFAAPPASVSSSLLFAQRRLGEGQPDGTTVGTL